MSDVTVVCCYNNEKMYNDFVKTVKSQTIPCEIIGIDNRGNKGFTSCAAAYNSVINDIKTKYVVYSHQDILLTDDGAMSKFVGYLEGIGHDDILGVAGVKFDTRGIYANFRHKSVHTGEFFPAGPHRVEGGIMECDTVDECFFGGYTEHFRENQFDEVLCDNWHLYAVEACLRTKSNYVHQGEGAITVCTSAMSIYFTFHPANFPSTFILASAGCAGITPNISPSYAQRVMPQRQTALTLCFTSSTELSACTWAGSNAA